jgi:uncharacterized membrane protein
MAASACFIAQLSDAGEKSGQVLSEILPWLIVLAGVVLAGGVVIYFIRRSIKNADSGGSATGGFTLQDLREMHAAGELTEEEFERAKALMIGRAKAGPASTAPAGRNPGAGQ